MPTGEYRLDDLAAFRRRIESLERQLADQQRRAPLRSSSISDEDGNIIVRFNPNGLQFLHPTTGNEVAAFAGENLSFRDDAGNALAQVDESGIHVFDTGANEITTIDDLGLTVADNLGVDQLRAGNLDGAGDYGVEVAGGRLRAVDFTFDYNLESNVALTTTAAAHNTVTITPPSWTTRSVVTGQLGFQMANGSGATQRMHFRVDVDGNPGTGLWSHWVAAGLTANTFDMTVAEVVGNSAFDVDAIASVNTGTNNNNHLRLGVSVMFLR